MKTLLPLPPVYTPDRADQIWEPRFTEIEKAAEAWARQHTIAPANQDKVRVALVPIDVQNSFCIPGYELFVAGRSGQGAVEDSRRTAQLIYQNLDVITDIVPTLDTHILLQIFFRLCWINEQGEHPVPNATVITLEQIRSGVWRPNPAVAPALFGGDVDELNRYFLHYATALTEGGQYPITVWDYHCMQGTIGHAMVSLVWEAIFFHNVARKSQPQFLTKGLVPYSEMYSPFAAEVNVTHTGQRIAEPNTAMLDHLLTYDMVIVLGQAKSHCVSWALDHLLKHAVAQNPTAAQKIYLVEDCTSPVVIPHVVDYTTLADAAVQRFQDMGLRVVRSTQPIREWPGAPF